jgi:hypothetical protein
MISVDLTLITLSASVSRICPLLCCFYLSDALSTVKCNKGPTPSPYSHPSRPSFEELKEDVKENLLQAGPLTARSAKGYVSVAFQLFHPTCHLYSKRLSKETGLGALLPGHMMI